MVRESKRRVCKCHGVSGVCYYKACWDQLLDFDEVTLGLRQIYLFNATPVELSNIGGPETPELILVRLDSTNKKSFKLSESESSRYPTTLHDPMILPTSSFDRPGNFKFRGDLFHLQDSPDYCIPQAIINHGGTSGRACNSKDVGPVISNRADSDLNVLKSIENQRKKISSLDGHPGSCERLCCNRGHYSELVLDLVECSCRFKFCCSIECHYCLRQRVQNYCL